MNHLTNVRIGAHKTHEEKGRGKRRPLLSRSLHWQEQPGKCCDLGSHAGSFSLYFLRLSSLGVSGHGSAREKQEALLFLRWIAEDGRG